MKTFAQHILAEKRSHPELNPKVSINQIIVDSDKSTTSKIAGIKNLFVSMTNKIRGDTPDVGYPLGINTQSTYNTPIGIYSYPIKYVIDKVGNEQSLRSLPYVGGMPYVNIFSVKGNIINLSTMSVSQLKLYTKKLYPVVNKIMGKDYDYNAIVSEVIDLAPHIAYDTTPGGQLWYITMELSTRSVLARKTKNPSITWNRIFREIGIDGCIDQGDGIIHTNEPTQAVFFNPGSIAKNTRYDNKYSPEQQQPSLMKGFFKSNGRTRMSDNELISILQSDFQLFFTKADFPNLSEKVLLKYVLRAPISYIFGYKDKISAKQITPTIVKTILERDPISLNRMDSDDRFNGKITPVLLDVAIEKMKKMLRIYQSTEVHQFKLTIKKYNENKYQEIVDTLY